MLRQLILYLLLFFIVQSACAQEELSKLNSKTVNWGFKVGFNALSSTHYNVWKNDIEIEDKSFTNNVGFSGGIFLRINLNNFFMQSEAGYSLTKEHFSFTIPPQEIGNSPLTMNFKASYQSLSLPVLAGYNIAKDGPYLFNIFLGPDFRYNYLINFNQNRTSFSDKEAKYYINGLVGFSINISHLYFDFRYEICRPNTDVRFNNIPEAPEYLQNIHIKKNENLLNFSFGLIF